MKEDSANLLKKFLEDISDESEAARVTSTAVAVHVYKAGDSHILHVVYDQGQKEITKDMGSDDKAITQLARAIAQGDNGPAKAVPGTNTIDLVKSDEMRLLSLTPRIYAIPEFISEAWVEGATSHIGIRKSDLTLSTEFERASGARFHLVRNVKPMMELAMPSMGKFPIRINVESDPRGSNILRPKFGGN